MLNKDAILYLKLRDEEMLNQESMLYLLKDVFIKSSKIYKKNAIVFAREAIEGERIDTITSDGKETSNTAKVGDYVIQAQTTAKEQYIVPKSTLLNRYVKVEMSAPKGWSAYRATGQCYAIPFEGDLYHSFGGTELNFKAPWGEPMVVKQGDMLATDVDYTEIYRIARKEFEETYELTSPFLI